MCREVVLVLCQLKLECFATVSVSPEYDITHCSGDMTMATWGGSTAQSVDSNEGESDEGEYDNNYEGDTTLQHTGR